MNLDKVLILGHQTYNYCRAIQIQYLSSLQNTQYIMVDIHNSIRYFSMLEQYLSINMVDLEEVDTN